MLPPPLLVLLLATSCCAGAAGAAFADELVGGQDAIALLGLEAAGLPLPGILSSNNSQQQQGLSPARLKELLLRDPDLRVHTANLGLVSTCRGLGGRLANATRAAPGRMRLHSAGATSRGSGRLLQQMLQANLDDPAPSSLKVNSAGLPLLHRCAPAGWPCRCRNGKVVWVLVSCGVDGRPHSQR
jgi:hypothetical protein